MKVTSIRDETRATRVVRLAVDGQDFAYRAGQAAQVGLADRQDRVPYSIASAPEETSQTGEIEFLVKVEEDGSWGPHLDGMAPGSEVEVRGPFGGFFFPDEPDTDHLLFVAGGTGIAPIRAMIRHVQLAGHGRRVQLLYSARTSEDFAYLRELREMAARREIQLALTITRASPSGWRGEQGRITTDLLRRFVGTDPPLAFVCGPSAMVGAVARMLEGIGVEDARILVERWEKG